MPSKVVASITAVNIVLVACLVLAGCAATPDDEDDAYLDQAREARDAQNLDEAQQLAQMADDQGHEERETQKILADVARLRAAELLDDGDHRRAYDAYLDAAAHEPSRRARGDDLRDALAAGEQANRPGRELLDVALDALSDAPADADLRRHIARLAEDVGDDQLAAEHYLWLFSADPDDTRAGFRLGILYLGIDRPADAVSVLRRVYDAEPENVQAALNLAGAYGQIQRYEEAVAIFDALLEEHPDHPAVLRSYADFESQRGNEDRARQLEQKAGDASPGVDEREMRPLR